MEEKNDTPVTYKQIQLPKGSIFGLKGSHTDQPEALMDEQSLAVAKWGDGARAGFQMLPDLLLKHQNRLGLGAADLVVLINITLHWWKPDQNPFPRTSTIADRMGIDVRSVQRSLNRLQKLGLVGRAKREGGGVEYDLKGLVNKLEELAKSDMSFLVRKAAWEKSHVQQSADIF